MPTGSATSLRAVLKDCVQNAQIFDRFLHTLSPLETRFLLHDWLVWARDDQLPPACAPNGEAWTTWLFLGGRGAGKTRAGAEWVRGMALGLAPFASAPVERIALLGPQLDEARAVMVEGVSGLMAVHATAERPRYSASRGELEWPNGAKAQLFSAADPESLRGPQFAAAWCDELGKWTHAEAAWDMLQFSLRLGPQPRQLVTTTPRARPIIKRLLADPRTVITRAATHANAGNLAPAFLDEIVGRYRGTRLGRQELNGELIEDRDDGLWQRDVIERARIHVAPSLSRIVVGVDPPVTSGANADACGIIAAGRSDDGRAFVLADTTLQGARPLVWAQAVARLHDSLEADCIVAEVNQGGELVAQILTQAAPHAAVRMVRASRGKYARAEPVAALYERGLVAHVGVFPELEDEMCALGPGEMGRSSPDRVDALVWALTELMLSERKPPRLRALGG
jgi:phage terminase large subunit-like protein